MRTGLALVGTLISLLVLLLVFWHVDRKQVVENVRHLGWGNWLIGVAIYMSSFLPRGWRWKLMLPESRRLPWSLVTKFVVIGYAANNILPFRLGEVVRSVLAGDCFKLPKLTCLATIAAEKILDGCCLLGLLAASLPFIHIQSDSTAIFNRMFLVATFIFGAAVTGCSALAFWNRLILKWAERFGPRFVLRLISALTNALAVIKQKRVFLSIAGLTLVIWLVESMCFVYFLDKMGVENSWAKGIFCLVVVNLSILVPSAPGYLGVFQGGAVAAFLAMGMNKSTGLAFGVAAHAAQFIPTTLAGVTLAALMGLHWQNLYRLKNE
jgi:uncharacterized protein (TIRG00374 family)